MYLINPSQHDLVQRALHVPAIVTWSGTEPCIFAKKANVLPIELTRTRKSNLDILRIMIFCLALNGKYRN